MTPTPLRPRHSPLRYLRNAVRVKHIFPLMPCVKDKMAIPLHLLCLPRVPWQIAETVVSASVVVGRKLVLAVVLTLIPRLRL